MDADISELDLNASHLHEMQHQISEEITVARRGPKLTWVAGAFLFREVDHQPSSTLAFVPRLENRIDPRVEARAGAVFGQATVSLAPRVSATAGLRYTHEDKTIDNAGSLYTLDAPVTLVSRSYDYSDAISGDAWTPKFGAEFRARENLFAYVSATRGFKSGGFNLTSPESGRGFDPEWAWSYEGGLKAVVGAGRSTLNVAAFRTDYSDLQVQTGIRPGVIDISNAAAATITGIELEGTTLLGDAVQAGGHVAWLNAKYDRYVAIGPGGRVRRRCRSQAQQLA